MADIYHNIDHYNYIVREIRSPALAIRNHLDTSFAILDLPVKVKKDTRYYDLPEYSLSITEGLYIKVEYVEDNVIQSNMIDFFKSLFNKLDILHKSIKEENSTKRTIEYLLNIIGGIYEKEIPKEIIIGTTTLG